MATQLQKEFYLHKAGIKLASKRSKDIGDLLLDGKAVEWNKPFAILNMLKSTKYAHIFPRKRLKPVGVIINK